MQPQLSFWKKLIALLLVMVMALGYAQPAQAATGNVQGTLYDKGAVVADATVWVQDIVNDNWYPAITDEAGEFAFDLADGQYRLAKAYGIGYIDDLFFTVANGQLQGSNHLYAQVAARSLPGRLMDGTQPIAHFDMNLHRVINGKDYWYSVVTDANGYFAGRLPDGTYELYGLYFSATDEWKEVRRTIKIQGAYVYPNPYLIDVQANLISGSVKLEHLTVPGEQFHIRDLNTGEWYTQKTDANGDFQVYLPDGDFVVETFWIHAQQKSYSVWQTFSVRDGQVTATSGHLANPPNLVIELAAPVTGNVQGMVSDANYNPVYKQVVYVQDLTTGNYIWAFTNSVGEFGYDLPDGQYRFSDVGNVRTDVFFSVSNGQLVDQTRLDIVLPAVAFQGQLTDGGIPVANGEMILARDINGKSYYYAVQTDANGYFQGKLYDGTYRISHVWFPNSTEADRPINQTVQILGGTTNPNPYNINIENN